MLTSRHRGPKRKLRAGYSALSRQRTSYPCTSLLLCCVCYMRHSIMLCTLYFSSSSVVSCTFFVPCVYSKFGHHPHPLGYLCAKFRFCSALRCWASPQRKIAYSITQPAYLMRRKPKLLLQKTGVLFSHLTSQLSWWLFENCRNTDCCYHISPWLSPAALYKNRTSFKTWL